MISDVLSDALASIREYRTDPATRSAYDAISPELDVLVAAMTAMRVKLDTPPTVTPRKPAMYPGYRTMTGAQRYNARMHKIFDDARARQAQS